ncbi:hypothetical protein B0H12DRAFT_1242790 [Mycena haematopus]|nr:hypothetical protein B0H12DRAFT_1242790 [Mycena haematopus]
MSSAVKPRTFLGARRVPPSTPARQSTTVSDRVRDAPRSYRVPDPAVHLKVYCDRLESLLKDDAGGALSTTMPLNSHPFTIVHRVSLHRSTIPPPDAREREPTSSQRPPARRVPPNALGPGPRTRFKLR